MYSNTSLGLQIKKLILEGCKSYEICKQLSIKPSTVSYYKSKLNLLKSTYSKYNWKIINQELIAGKSLKELKLKYGFSTSALNLAIKTNKINRSKVPTHRMTALEYSDYINGKKCSSNTARVLKRKLIKEGKPEKCDNLSCGLTHWLGQKAPLQLDHIDGDPTNNRLNNLRFLCPNCHFLTPTWGNKKRV